MREASKRPRAILLVALMVVAIAALVIILVVFEPSILGLGGGAGPGGGSQESSHGAAGVIDITSFTVSPGSVIPGQEVKLSVKATGGIGPLTYAYAGITGCDGHNTSSLSCSPNTPGSYMAEVNVTDSARPTRDWATATAVLVVDNITLTIDVDGHGNVPLAQSGSSCTTSDTACFTLNNSGGCTFTTNGNPPLVVTLSEDGDGVSGQTVSLEGVTLSIDAAPSLDVTTGSGGAAAGQAVFTALTGELPPQENSGGVVSVTATLPGSGSISADIFVDPPNTISC